MRLDSDGGRRNWSSASGRVWPGHTMGICRVVVVDAVAVVIPDVSVTVIVVVGLSISI